MQAPSSRPLYLPRSTQRLGTPPDRLLDRLSRHLFSPEDIAFLVYVRIVFGAILLWEIYRYFTHNWISSYYIEPSFLFTYYGFSWVKPWPGSGMYIHFFALGLLAVCIVVGFCYRIAATLFFIGFTYVFLLDQTHYLNHFYFVSLISFLLIFLPANRALSLDTLLRPGLRSDVVPAWTLWLLRAQIGIVYFYAGLAKLSADWLRGEPMRMWLSPLGDMPGFGFIFKGEWFIYLFVIGGLLLDLLIVPFLLWRRTRLYAFLAGVAFHVFNALMFPIGIFPWFMLGLTLIFFPPDLMRRLVRAFLPPAPRSLPDTKNIADSITGENWSPKQKVVAALLALYLLAQVILPFRHYAYPGDVNWTEEGHKFSWHMKLRGKDATAVFTISHPPSGQSWAVDPAQYLTWKQLEKMPTQPEMILQFSHHLANEKRREGYGNVEVRAHVMASLNGRKPQLLIDPTIDLAKERISVLPTHWIMPLTEPLPAGRRPAKKLQGPRTDSFPSTDY
jgi:hypothetical protein